MSDSVVLHSLMEEVVTMEMDPTLILNAKSEKIDTDKPDKEINDLHIKEKNVIENHSFCDIEVKEEIPTSNIIIVRIKKKKGKPRRSEPFHLYTPDLFQSLFGFSIYQCHGDSEWRQVLKNKAGNLHFKSNGTRILDFTPLPDVKPLKVNQGRELKKKTLKVCRSKITKKNNIIKVARPSGVIKSNLQKDFFNVKVESISFNKKEDNSNPLDYVSCCIGEKPFLCNLCNMCFKERKTCRTHIEQVHFKIRHYKCEFCYKTFYFSAGLRKHVGAVHLKLKPFACKICKKSFATTTSLNRHMSTHEESGRFECPTCGKKIRHSTTFQEHMDIHNNVKYMCLRCEKGFSTKKTLKIHMLKHDPLFVPKISCSKCNKLFVNSAILKKHESVVHPTTKYPCSICKKAFPILPVLNKHMSNVHGNTDKLFKCEQCKTCYKNRGYLEQHIKSLHTYTLLCAHCPHKFTNKQRLAYHLKRYHASRSTYKPFSCNRCKAKFITYGHVKRHMASHLKNKPAVNNNLSCGKCDKKYKLKIALFKHEQMCK